MNFQVFKDVLEVSVKVVIFKTFAESDGSICDNALPVHLILSELPK